LNLETVRKWILKANNDLKVAKDELLTENPATDVICFHAQQCVEKYLKAYLIAFEKPIRKTHDIAELVIQCIKIDADFSCLYRVEIVSLTDYAVEVRYPDEFYFPPVEEAEQAVKLAEEVKNFVIEKLHNKFGGWEVNAENS